MDSFVEPQPRSANKYNHKKSHPFPLGTSSSTYESLAQLSFIQDSDHLPSSSGRDIYFLNAPRSAYTLSSSALPSYSSLSGVPLNLQSSSKLLSAHSPKITSNTCGSTVANAGSDGSSADTSQSSHGNERPEQFFSAWATKKKAKEQRRPNRQVLQRGRIGQLAKYVQGFENENGSSQVSESVRQWSWQLFKSAPQTSLEDTSGPHIEADVAARLMHLKQVRTFRKTSSWQAERLWLMCFNHELDYFSRSDHVRKLQKGKGVACLTVALNLAKKYFPEVHKYWKKSRYVVNIMDEGGPASMLTNKLDTMPEKIRSAEITAIYDYRKRKLPRQDGQIRSQDPAVSVEILGCFFTIQWTRAELLKTDTKVIQILKRYLPARVDKSTDLLVMDMAIQKEVANAARDSLDEEVGRKRKDGALDNTNKDTSLMLEWTPQLEDMILYFKISPDLSSLKEFGNKSIGKFRWLGPIIYVDVSNPPEKYCASDLHTTIFGIIALGTLYMPEIGRSGPTVIDSGSVAYFRGSSPVVYRACGGGRGLLFCIK